MSKKQKILVQPITKNITKKLLEIYQKNPCLWNTKCKEYTDRNLKRLGYEEIIHLLKPQIPNVDKEFIVKKVNTLRSAFRKEFKKVCDSIKIDPTNVYKPSLWYFDLLLFTVDDKNVIKRNKTNDEQQSIYTIDEMKSTNYDTTNDIDDGLNSSLQDEDVDIKGYINDNVTETLDTKSFVNNKLSTRKHDKQSIQEQHISSPCGKTIKGFSSTEINYKDEFDHFGYIVASKLRKIASKDENQQVICENIISQALMKGLLCKLSEDSGIK